MDRRGRQRAAQFADAGLLDEVLVTVIPVVLGAGKLLFDRPLPGGPMQLQGTHTHSTGMVELRYEIGRQPPDSSSAARRSSAMSSFCILSIAPSRARRASGPGR